MDCKLNYKLYLNYLLEMNKCLLKSFKVVFEGQS